MTSAQHPLSKFSCCYWKSQNNSPQFQVAFRKSSLPWFSGAGRGGGDETMLVALTHFMSLIYFCTHLNIKTPEVFACVQGVQKETIGMKWVNLFVPNAPFLYPLKTSENCKVFWCFQGVEKRCIGNEWVNVKLSN